MKHKQGTVGIEVFVGTRNNWLLSGLGFAVISPNGARHSLCVINRLRGGLLIPAEKLAKPTAPLRLGLWPGTNSQLCYAEVFIYYLKIGVIVINRGSKLAR